MEDFLRYLIDPHLFDPVVVMIIDYLRYLFIGIGLAMLVSSIYFIIRTNILEEKYFKDILEFTKTSAYKDIKLSINWDKILKRINSDDESNRKLAIIEADDLLNKALNEMGYQGANLEESLKDAGKEIVHNKEDLLKAHKVRRDMVYDPNYNLSEEDGKELISIYEETLDDLELLD